MLEQKSRTIDSKCGHLLQQELHMIHVYREILQNSADSPFVTLLATILEDHEKSARDLRDHVDDSAKAFVDKSSLNFGNEAAKPFVAGRTIEYLTEEEMKAIEICAGILWDYGSPEDLITCIRNTLCPRLQNHIAVLGIMTESTSPGR